MTDSECLVSLEDKPLVSIYTCVYNGEHTIHRVFESIKNINYPRIEHVIINDGSTDKTEDLISAYAQTVSYPVIYHRKENGGKHTALNVAWSLANGYFMIQLDADDELLPDSIGFLVKTYFNIPENIRDQYWCVHGRCITQHGDFVGNPYPDDINHRDWRAAQRIASRCQGEKIGLQVKKYLEEYRFPTVVGVHYLSEEIVWKQINAVYGTWYTNEVVRVYYVNEGGNLSARRTKRHQFGSLAFYHKWRLIHTDLYPRVAKDYLYYPLCYFIATKNYRKNNKFFDGIASKGDKLKLALLTPFMWLASFLVRWIRHIQ